MVEGIEVSKDQLKLSKLLYAKHPATRAKNVAKNRVKSLFDSLTLPFPERSVRLFPVHSEDPDEQNEEVEEFIRTIRRSIVDYDYAVRELQRAWPGILQCAQARLGDFFDPSDYPSAKSLPALLTVSFEPFNVELPNYYKAVSPEEYKRATAMLAARFEKAALMQEQHITAAFAMALDQMVESLAGYQDGKQKSFRNSVVEHVFVAFKEFREKTQKYGILQGTELERQFENVMQVMTGGHYDSETLSNVLRDDAQRRVDMIEKVGAIRDTILGLANDKPRRTLIRDDE